MVKVYIVGVVACVGCCGSVTFGWLGCVWFVHAYFGGCCVFVVGEWCDVFDWGVEPSASTDSTGGMVDPHSSGVQGVGSGGCVEFPDE